MTLKSKKFHHMKLKKKLSCFFVNAKQLSVFTLCHSVVFITCTRRFPLPQSNIMGPSKVTHIYPIIQRFEKTRIELQLMLRWGPKSERCYRPKRLGFQCPTNKRQSSPLRDGGLCACVRAHACMCTQLAVHFVSLPY